MSYTAHLGLACMRLFASNVACVCACSHDPNLSVRETLDFAYLCQSGTQGPKFDLPSEILKAKLNGMSHAAHAVHLRSLVCCNTS